MIEFFPAITNDLLFIIKGAGVTLQYSIVAVFFGLIIGTILAIFKTSRFAFLRIFGNFYTAIFRGTPLLIQLSIIYFIIPNITGIKLSVFFAGALAFSLNSGAYVSEIIRAGIASVDIGQFEAAEVLNIPKYLMMKDIILPQALRNILPSLINELVNMVKESAIISILGEMDLMRRAQMIASEKFDYFTPMITAAICYFVLIFIFSSLATILEKKLKL